MAGPLSAYSEQKRRIPEEDISEKISRDELQNLADIAEAESIRRQQNMRRQSVPTPQLPLSCPSQGPCLQPKKMADGGSVRTVQDLQAIIDHLKQHFDEGGSVIGKEPSFADKASDLAYAGVKGLGGMLQDPTTYMGGIGLLMTPGEAEAAPSWPAMIGHLQSLGTPETTNAARILYDTMTGSGGVAALKHLDPELAARKVMGSALRRAHESNVVRPTQQVLDLAPTLRALGY